MGTFYGSVHLKTDDPGAATPALEAVAQETGLSFLAAPPRNGWLSIYPSEHGQDERAGRLLAERLSDFDHIIQMAVHDDDVFCYWYYRRGARADAYSSRPDYFEPVSEQERASLAGCPEAFAELIGDPQGIEDLRETLKGGQDKAARAGVDTEAFLADVTKIEAGLKEIGAASDLELIPEQWAELERLITQRFGPLLRSSAGTSIFATHQMARFAEVLGIPCLLSSYEYLLEGEKDADLIEDLEQWTHVPAQSDPTGPPGTTAQ